MAEEIPAGVLSESGAPDPAMLAYMSRMREEFTRFHMQYRFAVDEILTKVTILREEFQHLHHYNPIEHVTSRVKSPASILAKTIRKGVDPDLPSIREHITDIAGVRITCSFIADTYRILDTLTAQADVRVIEIKDYVANPKPNGYKSLHAIVAIPVFLSTGPVDMTVELQIRTVAMDFWATLEHKIFYKFDGDVPGHVVADLTHAAGIAEDLDHRMEKLHTLVHGSSAAERVEGVDNTGELLAYLWAHARREGGELGDRPSR